MARNWKIGVAILALVILIATPAIAAAPSGTISWNSSSVQLGSTVGYSWSASNLAKVNITLTAPTGAVSIYNDTATSGASTRTLNTMGTWTLSMKCALNSTELDTATVEVGAYQNIVDIITGFADGPITAFINFVTATVPLFVIIALIPFIVGIFGFVLGKIKL